MIIGLDLPEKCLPRQIPRNVATGTKYKHTNIVQCSKLGSHSDLERINEVGYECIKASSAVLVRPGHRQMRPERNAVQSARAPGVCQHILPGCELQLSYTR